VIASTRPGRVSEASRHRRGKYLRAARSMA
jgi:hypothetical protein